MNVNLLVLNSVFDSSTSMINKTSLLIDLRGSYFGRDKEYNVDIKFYLRMLKGLK